MTDYTKNFSLNLRDLRIRKNLTQKELADLLQYSEKTVSKWECGACVPDIDVLFKIANIFKVGVENPFTNSGTYYLGIDGGGTKTALALSDEEGNIIRIHKTEGCNPVDIGIDRVKEILKDAIYEICKDISLSSVYCFAGIAGGDSAGAISVHSAFDGRKNSQATKYVNIELTGNTPPYKGDEGTWNTTIEERFPSASHHQTVATEKGIRAFGMGFAFTEVSANILWALNKMLGSDVWVITLKTRLGLLESVLATLPDEQHIVGKSFGFEAKHPEIFEGNLVGQMGVYFSYETRDHTMFGALNQGYSKDFQEALNMLFKGGICPHTVFEFPEDANKYPVILVPSPYKMLQSELDAMNTYISNGGKVIVCGPSAIPQCDSKWTLENKVPEGTRFFERNPERFNICYKWMNNFDFKPSADKYKWTNPCDGIFYHPYRISDMESTDSLFELCEKYCKAMPIKIQSAKGYLSSVFETDKEYIVHFLAADYDTDIDHKLDEMRYHRSRINYINKVEPIGIDGKITIEAQNVPLVYTPFNDDTYEVILKDGVCNIKLPEKCSYVILKFNK